MEKYNLTFTTYVRICVIVSQLNRVFPLMPLLTVTLCCCLQPWWWRRKSCLIVACFASTSYLTISQYRAQIDAKALDECEVYYREIARRNACYMLFTHRKQVAVRRITTNVTSIESMSIDARIRLHDSRLALSERKPPRFIRQLSDQIHNENMNSESRPAHEYQNGDGLRRIRWTNYRYSK